MTKSHRFSSGMPSILTQASKAIISASVDECDTAPCFLHIQHIGAKVLGPTRQRIPPDVLLLSFKSPAKEASQNSISLQSLASSPTKLRRTCSLQWYM